MTARDEDCPVPISDVDGFIEKTLQSLRLLRDGSRAAELDEAIRLLEAWQAKHAGRGGHRPG